jgi:hypothetical protein
MKKITLLNVLIALILIGGSSSLFAQKVVKPCYCSTGETNLTPEEAKILRDNYQPTTFRSNLNKPDNWEFIKYQKQGQNGKDQVFDSKGTEFWLTMMRNYDTSSPDLYLDITGSENASGSVEITGIGFYQTFTVAANTITRVSLPANAMVANDEIANKGIHVLSDKEVTVYGMNRITYTTDAFLGLPVDILSTQYLAMTYTGYYSASFAPEFAIVSPYNNNTIQIIPASNTVGGFIAGNTYNVVLNAGQVYQVIGTGDLTGSIIQSSLPVAFFSGNTCTNIPVGYGYCDHIVEQIPPNTTWGSTFVTYPLAGRANGDTWRFLAAQDNTELYINSVYITTLNFGDFYETILGTSVYITSTNPILTAQFSNGNTWDPQIPDNGDPFMTIIPPYQQFMSNYTFATPSSGFSLNYANLTVESVGVPYQYLDNILVNPASFNSISTSDFSGGALPLTIGTHTSNNSNSNQFGIYVYGFFSDDSYGYPGGLSLEFINQGSGPVITLTPETIIINSTSQPAGLDVEITAFITDVVEPFVQSATLYYRHIGDIAYQSVPMVHGLGDLWSGTVPAAAVLFPGFQYYIYATDGQLSATSPGVDPVNNPYSVAVDNDPPLIIHTPVTFAEIGVNIPISAQVTDITNFLQSVQLFYRVAGGNPVYTMLVMNNTSGDLFEAIIPGAQMTAQGVEYYIRATDNYGVISTSGTADNPYFIAAGTSQCVNPIFAGEIGNAQGNCGEFDPLPFTSIQLPSGYIGTLEYKWQYSTDFVSFFDIANSNLETYDPGMIAQTTWFKRLARVDCMNDWMGAAESNVVEITIYDPIAVTISESLLPEFCQGQGVNLAANVSITPAISYLWSTGETTQTIFTGISGIYTVTVTNAMGCEATASYDLTVDVTELLSSYVMLARGIIQMDKTTIHSGGLGVKAGASNKVLGLNYTMVTAEGTFAKAPNIFMDWTTNITNKIYSAADVVWPAFEPMTNPGTVNVVVPDNTTMTLSGNAYKTVKIGKNATVIFTEPVVDINGYLTMNLGSKIEFEQCTKIHLKGKFTAGKNVIINPDEFSVVFYIEGNVAFGSGAHVAGVFYLSSAEVYNFDVANSTSTQPAVFKGMYLAKVIYSGKNTNWYMSTMCNNCTSVTVKDLAVETPGIVTGSGAVLKNYPNPFSDRTTVNFMLPDDGHVTIDVFNLSGKLVQSLYNGDVNMNQEYTVEFDGSTLSKGLYIYKMTTNNEVVTGKMIVR